MSKHFSYVFERDKRRCVYCGRDLMVDFDTFMLAEEDHLVPRAASGEDIAVNLVIACAVCNRLKGKFVPDFALTPENRTKYINAIRDHVMERRARLMQDFTSWTHEEKRAPEAEEA